MPTNWLVITLDKKSTADQKKAIEAIANFHFQYDLEKVRRP